MRISLKNTVAASLAALTLALALAGPTPASAKQWFGGGGFHHHGFGGGLAIGVFGLAAGAAIAAEDNCVDYRPIYDRYGRYLGRRAINVCE
jgi:hypothetical protein